MRIYEFFINPEDEELGMTAISLVDRPAMESEFIAFNKQEKPKIFKFQDSVKRIVGGLALIPDKLIYRVDEETGEEYFGFFSKETIEMIVDKFMRDATAGTTKAVNLQHSDKTVQAHLMECLILRTQPMVDAIKGLGIEEACLGAVYMAYKFDTEEAFNLATSQNFTGFSIEIMLQKELKMSKNNNKFNNKYMTKVKNFVDKFKSLLAEIENASVFEDVNVPDSGKTLRIGEVGQPVLWVTADSGGTETTAPAEAGDYVLEDGRTVTVDAQGNLTEIKEKGTATPPIPQEGFAKYPWAQCIADMEKEYGDKKIAEKVCGSIKAKGISMEETNVETLAQELIDAGDKEFEEAWLACKKKVLEEVPLATSGDTTGTTSGSTSGNTTGDMPMPMPEASGATAADVEAKTLGELVTSDGVTVIKVLRENGVITEATVEAETELIKSTELSALKAENADLKEKLSKVVVKPAMNVFTTPTPAKKTAEELAKMNNLEKTMYRLGLDKEK